jgi:hypothetical protein
VVRVSVVLRENVGAASGVLRTWIIHIRSRVRDFKPRCALSKAAAAADAGLDRRHDARGETSYKGNGRLVGKMAVMSERLRRKYEFATGCTVWTARERSLHLLSEGRQYQRDERFAQACDPLRERKAKLER